MTVRFCDLFRGPTVQCLDVVKRVYLIYSFRLFFTSDPRRSEMLVKFPESNNEEVVGAAAVSLVVVAYFSFSSHITFSIVTCFYRRDSD